MRPIDDRAGQWRPAKRICTEHMSRLVHRTSVRTSNLIHGKGKAKPLYRILGLSQAYGNMTHRLRTRQYKWRIPLGGGRAKPSLCRVKKNQYG